MIHKRSKQQHSLNIFCKGILENIRERGRIDIYDYLNINNNDKNETSTRLQEGL